LNRTAEALYKRIKYLNEIEFRPASYKDLIELEVDGKQCKLEYGTLRNKVSGLKKKGYIERYYNSRASFFVVKGLRFGKRRTTQAKIEHSLAQLSKVIKQLPEIDKGIHDIHISFQVPNIWIVISGSKRFRVNEYNKGMILPYFNIDGLKITASIHHTDTVTVTVACSKNPITAKVDDASGIIRLAVALARTQDRIQVIVDECGQSLPGGYESIRIPDSSNWMITMWHFGVDSPWYREEKICMTWKDAQGVLLREYNKKKENKFRRERQEHPKISIFEATKKLDIKMNQPMDMKI
jgi:hypothetical protein